MILAYKYLHSNMELLLPKSYIIVLSINYVFTFQYGATSTFKFYGSKFRIYSFTFQYGATSTEETKDVDVSKIIFTFQYGATST